MITNSTITQLIPILSQVKRGTHLNEFLSDEENYCLEAGDGYIALYPQLITFCNVDKLFIVIEGHFHNFDHRINSFFVVPSVNYTVEELAPLAGERGQIRDSPEGGRALWIDLA